jgi:formylglycine-generating enzyme required for sulfatase activity
MILIPAGCFIGKDTSVVSISYDFYMDTTEVTTRDWNEIMSAASMIDTTVISMSKWKYILGFDTSTSLKPIAEVCRYQMIVYCNEKSKNDNRDTCYSYSCIQIDTNNNRIEDIPELRCDFSLNGFRLPTEDEWEYAYRAGGREEYYWGKDGNTLMEYPYTATYPVTAEDTSEISKYAWWAHNNDPSGAKDVAQNIPNIWHLYDIAGNVEEMVWDIVSDIEREKNRIDYRGQDAGPQSFRRAIVRGGAFNTKKPYILSAWWRQSSLEFNCTFSDAVGFRTVCTATP